MYRRQIITRQETVPSPQRTFSGHDMPIAALAFLGGILAGILPSIIIITLVYFLVSSAIAMLALGLSGAVLMLIQLGVGIIWFTLWQPNKTKLPAKRVIWGVGIWGFSLDFWVGLSASLMGLRPTDRPAPHWIDQINHYAWLAYMLMFYVIVLLTLVLQRVTRKRAK